MKKIYLTLLLSYVFIAGLSAQNVLLETSFEGPGFDEGWTIGVSQGIQLPPQDYPATGLEPWENGISQKQRHSVMFTLVTQQLGLVELCMTNQLMTGS